MYKIILKGANGTVECSRKFKSEWCAHGYAQKAVLNSYELYDYEIIKEVTKRGIKKKK